MLTVTGRSTCICTFFLYWTVLSTSHFPPPEVVSKEVHVTWHVACPLWDPSRHPLRPSTFPARVSEKLSHTGPAGQLSELVLASPMSYKARRRGVLCSAVAPCLPILGTTTLAGRSACHLCSIFSQFLHWLLGWLMHVSYVLCSVFASLLFDTMMTLALVTLALK